MGPEWYTFHYRFGAIIVLPVTSRRKWSAETGSRQPLIAHSPPMVRKWKFSKIFIEFSDSCRLAIIQF